MLAFVCVCHAGIWSQCRASRHLTARQKPVSQAKGQMSWMEPFAWGEAENIRQLNQSLCLFNRPSFPSLAISLPSHYSVCMIYMESRANWTQGLLHWRWKRADGLVLFRPPRTLSLDMTDLREQLQCGCAKNIILQNGCRRCRMLTFLKESYTILDRGRLFCRFPLLSSTIWPVISFFASGNWAVQEVHTLLAMNCLCSCFSFLP